MHTASALRNMYHVCVCVCVCVCLCICVYIYILGMCVCVCVCVCVCIQDIEVMAAFSASRDTLSEQQVDNPLDPLQADSEEKVAQMIKGSKTQDVLP